MKCHQCLKDLSIIDQADYPLSEACRIALECPNHVRLRIIENQIVFYLIYVQNYVMLATLRPHPKHSFTQITQTYESDGYQKKELFYIPSFIPLQIKNDIIQITTLKRLLKIKAFA